MSRWLAELTVPASPWATDLPPPRTIHRLTEPTSSSLTAHRRPAAASSSAEAEGLRAFPLTKYLPVTSATSADEARKTDVRAPFSGVRTNGLITFNPTAKNPRVSPSRPYPVATVPGWTEFTVTPVPAT